MARILIVEDEPLIAMMLAEWLVELGHEGPAETVGDALRMIEETAPSAAILDINLQDQRCDAVAQVLATRSIPIAFATGSHVDEVPAGHGAAQTITKPYDFETVRQVIASMDLQQA
jgi:CheY-like chemotaxis protein